MNYLQLVNAALRRLNEVELTSSTFTTTIGFQSYMKDAINDAIRDIYADELEWPFAYAAQSQTLTSGVGTYSLGATVNTVDWDSFYVSPPELITNGNFTSNISGWTSLASGTGSVAYTSTGNGRMRLNTGVSGVAAAEQAISTINGRKYRVKLRLFGGSLTFKVGTTSEGQELFTAEALSFTTSGGGQFYTKTFTATGATAYIGIVQSANADYDLDMISVKEDVRSKALEHIDINDWHRNLRETDDFSDTTSYEQPCYVLGSENSEFILSPMPDKDYTVSFNAWTNPVLLSVYTDEPDIPERFQNIIIDRALYYGYLFRDNIQEASIINKKYEMGLGRMRRILVNRAASMRSDNYNYASRRYTYSRYI